MGRGDPPPGLGLVSLDQLSDGVAHSVLFAVTTSAVPDNDKEFAQLSRLGYDGGQLTSIAEMDSRRLYGESKTCPTRPSILPIRGAGNELRRPRAAQMARIIDSRLGLVMLEPPGALIPTSETAYWVYVARSVARAVFSARRLIPSMHFLISGKSAGSMRRRPKMKLDSPFR